MGPMSECKGSQSLAPQRCAKKSGTAAVRKRVVRKTMRGHLSANVVRKNELGLFSGSDSVCYRPEHLNLFVQSARGLLWLQTPNTLGTPRTPELSFISQISSKKRIGDIVHASGFRPISRTL